MAVATVLALGVPCDEGLLGLFELFGLGLLGFGLGLLGFVLLVGVELVGFELFVIGFVELAGLVGSGIGLGLFEEPDCSPLPLDEHKTLSCQTRSGSKPFTLSTFRKEKYYVNSFTYQRERRFRILKEIREKRR